MAKRNSVIVRLKSTGLKKDIKSKGVEPSKLKTGYFKVTRINPKNGKEKIRKQCFDPRAWNIQKQTYGMHVEFIEAKDK